MKYQYNGDLNREIAILNWDNREFKVPRVLKQRYEIIDILSVGGMGVIFIAKDKNLFDKKVLIKRCLYDASLFKHKNDISRGDRIVIIRESMDTEYTAMLHGWARKIPNIPIPLDKFTELNPELYGPHKDVNGSTFVGEKEFYETEPYIVVNYFSGETVKSDHYQIQNNIIGFCEYYLKSVAKILSRFHQIYSSEVGDICFYYCDLKPGNVIFTEEKQIVLIDMGSFAIVVDDDLQNTPATTPGYCAPELAKGQTQYISPAVDVYTLAITVFELVTGKKLIIDQLGNVELDWQAFKEIVSQANAIHWIAIFEKALQPLPNNRYATLDDFTSAFNMSFTKYDTSYIYKHTKIKLIKEISITNSWKAELYNLETLESMIIPIINFPVWREEKLFQLSSIASAINQNYKLSSLHLNLLQELFSKSVNHLTKNKTYLPELLELTGNGTYINYVPFFPYVNYISDSILKRWLEKIIYLFINCLKGTEMLVGLSPQTIKFDSLGNPFFNEFWLLFDIPQKYLLENPLICEALGNNLILPPELKEQRRWGGEKSYSYLAGIFLLTSVCPIDTKQLYRSNRLTNKIDYERLIRNLQVKNDLKELILLLINPNPANRPTLFEALSKLKERKNTIVKREIVKDDVLGIKIQLTNKLSIFTLQHFEINNKINKFIKYYEIENYIILNKEPTDMFKEILVNSNCNPIVSPINCTHEVTSLLKKAVKNKQTKVAVLIIDDSVYSIKSELTTILSQFSKVLLFSRSNPFDLKNLDFFPLDNYMIKKEKKYGPR